MRVKTAELKANLSRYVRQVRETGEAVEILLRDETVAYLTPVVADGEVCAAAQAERMQLERAFVAAGLACEWSSQDQLSRPNPTLAGDGSTTINSIAAMRGEKEW